MKYRHNNTDTNEKDIVKALRKIPGVTVITGVDDIICGYKGFNYMYEIKNPSEIAKSTGKPFNRNNKTRIKQSNLEAIWTGHYRIVSTLDEILDELKMVRNVPDR